MAVPAPLHDRMEKGGKVLLPASALTQISQKNVVWNPLLFKITTTSGRSSHCGLWEFTAAEGQVVMPRWMMSCLGLKTGDHVQIETAALPKGGLCKLRPREFKFTELANPRVVLEFALKAFSCLSEGDSIPIQQGTETFTLDVMELKTEKGSIVKAVCIVDCDLKVEFERPLDMPDSPVRQSPAVSGAKDMFPSDLTFTPQTTFAPPSLGTTPNLGGPATETAVPKQKAPEVFSGTGRTLSGRPNPTPTAAKPEPAQQEPAKPTYTVPSGGRTLGGGPAPTAGKPLGGGNASGSSAPATAPSKTVPESKPEAGFQPFAGKGRSLK